MDEKHIDPPQTSATPNITAGQRTSDAAHLDPAHAVPVELRHPDGRIEHPSVGHEQIDLKLLGVAMTLILLGLALAAVGVSARWLLRGETRLRSERFAASMRRPAVELPRQPRLEPLEPQFPAPDSFAAEEQAAQARLRGQAPATKDGFVRIPIDKAIEHVAKGLRSSDTAKPQAKSRGLVGGGDANSGRMLREDAP